MSKEGKSNLLNDSDEFVGGETYSTLQKRPKNREGGRRVPPVEV